MTVTALHPRRLERRLERIRHAVIGDGAVVDGPFGPRRLVYADWTASGRSLEFVEDDIRDAVLPLYANTHTEASATGRQTTRLREDARRIVHRAVGGGDDDVVVFCGSGATGAIDRLIRVLELGRGPRPVVFVGPFEHHSNELPWRESAADVVAIREDANGRLDVEHLRAELERYAGRALKIGSFSAASNVTGVVTDADAVSIVLHRHGALAFWDCAAAAPHLPIDMNPAPAVEDGELAYKDAVFISPHKLPGGPGTPGVLVAKRHLFANEVPAVPGGGTVEYVTERGQTYLADPVHREEAGTPGIVESIRAGLVFALREDVGAEAIAELEDGLVRRALATWTADPRLRVLGNPGLERVGIVSLAVRHPLPGRPDAMLHPGFVVALLDDLFGIQARSGCFCAAPYVHRLAGVGAHTAAAIEREALRGGAGLKPGFFRLSFAYFTGETELRYLVDAVHFVAEHGWKLLPLYRFDPASGLWRHPDRPPLPGGGLERIYLGAGAERETAPEVVLPAQLEEARRIVARIEARPPAADPPPLRLSAEFERLRWFPLPAEALTELRATRS